MKKMGKILGLLVGMALCLAPGISTFAEEAKPPLNTVCPVSGRAADAKVTTVYQGKEYAFCCKNCLAKFEKNPEKYLAKMKEGAPAKEEHAGHLH